uniref:Uncharacterized protein n=1 Tax=Rhizophora mucronata TaxID=61149 RepID=A0A2P2PW56_RHIMU
MSFAFNHFQFTCGATGNPIGSFTSISLINPLVALYFGTDRAMMSGSLAKLLSSDLQFRFLPVP